MNFLMRKSIKNKLFLILDQSPFSKAKFANIENNFYDIEIINFEKDFPEKLREDIKKIKYNKNNQFLNLVSNENFCLYRAKVYQIFSEFSFLEPFGLKNFSKDKNILKWTYIEDNVYVAKDSKIGLMSIIGKNSKIHKQSNIGNFVSIGENVEIGSNVKIGSNVVIGDNLKIPENSIITKNNEIKNLDKKNLLILQKNIKLVDTDFYNSTLYFYNS